MDEQKAMEKCLVLYVWKRLETRRRKEKREEEEQQQQENRGEAEEQ